MIKLLARSTRSCAMTPNEVCGRHLNEELRAVGKHQAERIAQHFSPIDGSCPFRLSWEFGQHAGVMEDRRLCAGEDDLLLVWCLEHDMDILTSWVDPSQHTSPQIIKQRFSTDLHCAPPDRSLGRVAPMLARRLHHSTDTNRMCRRRHLTTRLIAGCRSPRARRSCASALPHHHQLYVRCRPCSATCRQQPDEQQAQTSADQITNTKREQHHFLLRRGLWGDPTYRSPHALMPV